MPISKFRELDCERRPCIGGWPARPDAELCSLRAAALVWVLASALLWFAVVALWRMA